MAQIDMTKREALRSAEERAAAYDPDGLYDLAKMYENPPEGGWIEKNLDEALWYYCASVWAAFKLGKRYKASAYAAGRLLYYGTGKQQDTQLGYHYFKFASDAGNKTATYLLGVYHTGLTNQMNYGCGFPRNPVIGFNYLRKAADAGSTNAMVLLTTCYLEGIGVMPDMNEATAWSVRAAAKGNVTAMYNSGVLFERQLEYRNAGYWFNEAASRGDQGAAKSLRHYKYNSILRGWVHID